MTWDLDHKLGLAAGVCLLLGAFALDTCTRHPVHAREGWEGRPLICDPKTMEPDEYKVCTNWISNVQRPDEAGSCCGEADAFQADAWEMSPDGEFVAIISKEYPGGVNVDDGDGGTMNWPGLSVGTKIVIPKHKVNRAFTEDGEPIANGRNPTGHGIVFLRTNGEVLCYFAPTLSGLPGPQFANRSTP